MKLNQISKIITVSIFACFLSQANAQQETAHKIYQKPLFNFDYDKPTFALSADQKKNENRMLRYSLLTGYREGIAPVPGLAGFGTYIDKDNGTLRVYMINLSILEMLNLGFAIPSNKVVLNVKDPNRYRYTEGLGDKDEWLRNNAYCFEYMIPYGVLKNPEILRNEISQYFNVKLSHERRFVESLVLYRTSLVDKIKSKGGSPELSRAKLVNVRLGSLSQLIDIAGFPPLIDETGYLDSVDLEFDKNDFRDVNALKKVLARYDLDVKIEKRELMLQVVNEIKTDEY